LKTSLQLKLGQHLALTPQLQQSIRLLQLSTLELNQELDQILADNPLLERLDDPFVDAVRLDAGGSMPGAGFEAPASAGSGPATASEGEAGGDGPGSDRRADGDWEDGGSDWEPAWQGEGGRASDDDNDERSLPQLASSGRSLRDHLIMQLAATQCSRMDRALVELLIDNLGDDGYLESSLEELGAMLPESLDIEPEQLRTALRLLQSFEPTGVGARDLAESLRLQLLARPATGTPGAETTRRLALAIVELHLPLLAAKDFARLKRLLHCDDDALRAAQALIRSLDPRPGAAYATDEPAYVVPDVIVRRGRAGWTAQLNPAVLPKLRVNDLYAQILRRSRGASGAGGAGGMGAQLQEARWLIKNVQQRFDTILRVSQAIVERQRAFFSHGEVAMRPLVLREIAEELGLHESTVSRVTTQKYMLTPSGTFELKYFFGSHVATEAGGAASSTAIRALIRQLIAAEDARHPLSDSRLAELLGEQGIVVARRTVAKYREALQIAPVAQRKVL
jgi:RNA polymerase sigma-54 factor